MGSGCPQASCVPLLHPGAVPGARCSPHNAPQRGTPGVAVGLQPYLVPPSTAPSCPCALALLPWVLPPVAGSPSRQLQEQGPGLSSAPLGVFLPPAEGPQRPSRSGDRQLARLGAPCAAPAVAPSAARPSEHAVCQHPPVPPWQPLTPPVCARRRSGPFRDPVHPPRRRCRPAPGPAGRRAETVGESPPGGGGGLGEHGPMTASPPRPSPRHPAGARGTWLLLGWVGLGWGRLIQTLPCDSVPMSPPAGAHVPGRIRRPRGATGAGEVPAAPSSPQNRARGAPHGWRCSGVSSLCIGPAVRSLWPSGAGGGRPSSNKASAGGGTRPRAPPAAPARCRRGLVAWSRGFGCACRDKVTFYPFQRDGIYIYLVGIDIYILYICT